MSSLEKNIVVSVFNFPFNGISFLFEINTKMLGPYLVQRIKALHNGENFVSSDIFYFVRVYIYQKTNKNGHSFQFQNEAIFLSIIFLY